jgi:hypothetical protein
MDFTFRIDPKRRRSRIQPARARLIRPYRLIWTSRSSRQRFVAGYILGRMIIRSLYSFFHLLSLQRSDHEINPRERAFHLVFFWSSA